jgi:hypothetical protein
MSNDSFSHPRYKLSMLRKINPHLALLPAAFILAACASTPTAPAITGGGLIHERNQGYSILYKLMSDESDVGKIFILKSADEPVKNQVKEIGAAAQAAKKQMDEFRKQDKELEYDIADLPYLEQHGRDLQAKDDEKALLFSSGREFELRLVFTQAQAMDYAMQLSRGLAEKEDDPARKSFLQNLTKQTGDFHDQLMKLLTVK